MTKITEVEIHEFGFNAINLGNLTGADSVGAVGYAKGSISRVAKFAVIIRTDDGCQGEYVTQWCGTPSTCAQTKMLAPKLIGREAEHREGIYDDMKRELRHPNHGMDLHTKNIHLHHMRDQHRPHQQKSLIHMPDPTLMSFYRQLSQLHAEH